MFAGHYAPALAVRKIDPDVPLWALFLAAQGVDIGFYTLSLFGIEAADMDRGRVPLVIVESGAWTHSLASAAFWGAVVFAIGLAMKKPRAGALLAAVTMGHWVLDLIVHVADLPLAPGSPVRFGLGLWMHPVAAYVVEIALIALGTAIGWRGNRRDHGIRGDRG